jgi:hypothetical protein
VLGFSDWFSWWVLVKQVVICQPFTESQATKKAPMAPFLALQQILLAGWQAETLVEAVNTATGSNFTLFTSVERVAVTTNVQVQIVTHC